MSWIKTIGYQDASDKLKRIYDRIKGPKGVIDNVLSIHSLRPHSLNGHMSLYKSVLHHSGNSLPKWYLEAIGIYVSLLNQCSYCVEHHFAGLQRLLNDEEKGSVYLKALKNDSPEICFNTKECIGLVYAKKLTYNPESLTELDIKTLKEVGFTDGEILEVNQVASYFNYVNRTVLGLGVNTKGDILGLSPSSTDDPENWNHS